MTETIPRELYPKDLYLISIHNSDADPHAIIAKGYDELSDIVEEWADGTLPEEFPRRSVLDGQIKLHGIYSLTPEDGSRDIAHIYKLTPQGVADLKAYLA